jgi:hypothetical protein
LQGGYRICPRCSTRNGTEDLFCTKCGTDLVTQRPAAHSSEADSVSETATLVGTTVAAPMSPLTPTPKGSAPWTVGRWRTAIGLTALLAIALLVLWRIEAGHSHRLSSRLRTTRVELAVAQKQLASTSERLKSTTAISQRRKQVLLRAQAVLATVDPLLSSVDNLQKRTSDIQNGRDVFSSGADTLIGDLIILGNYLIQTDPSYIDVSYEQGLIDTANADLSTVRVDQASLSSYDASYGSASASFGRRADAFTQAVRKLQHQLQAVASK